MNDTSPNSAHVRTFTTTSPIEACRLRLDDLKRLYRIINDRQIEYSQTVLGRLAQLSTETSEQFQERRNRVANSFVTTINITGDNNEIVSGSGESFLSAGNIPEKILTIFYTTIAGPSAVGITPPMLENRATLLLDFSRPTALDFSKPPTLATQNISNFQISSSSESWFAALNARLTQFFNERRTGFDWLHKPGVYDLLLLIIGLPFALSIDYIISALVERSNLPSVFKSAVYVYFFFLGLYIFRGSFAYSRWVFPKIEIASETSPPLRHRAVWGAIMIGVFGAVFGWLSGMQLKPCRDFSEQRLGSVPNKGIPNARAM